MPQNTKWQCNEFAFVMHSCLSEDRDMNVFSRVVWNGGEDEPGRFEPSVLERITDPEFMAEKPWDREHVGGGRHL